MSGSENAGLEVFLTGLRNQHAVENQAISLLSRQAERLENYPEMEARMRQHIQESESQAKRLEELLERRGTSASMLKDTVTTIGANIAALVHPTAPDEVIKNTLANFAFEHYEMAAYCRRDRSRFGASSIAPRGTRHGGMDRAEFGRDDTTFPRAFPGGHEGGRVGASRTAKLSPQAASECSSQE